MKRALLEKLVEARAASRSVALVSDLKTSLQSLVFDDVYQGSLGLEPAVLAQIRDRLAADRSGLVDTGEGRLFVDCHPAPLRLILVGAVHIAQALAPMAQALGYGVTIIDPRGAFATPERFPGMALIRDWPDEGVTALAPDRRSALVTLTHDPKLDDPALSAGLASTAFYIGALGSRKTHAARLERLAASGIGEDQLGRIHGPVGLAIGAKSPAEIAVAILAQMTAALRQPAG